MPDFLREAVAVFEKQQQKIDSSKNDTNELRLKSDDVLELVRPGLEKLGYRVEKSKKRLIKLEFQSCTEI